MTATRNELLNKVAKAIREKRAYLETFCGKRLVTGYNDATGWAITNNTGSFMNQQSFMVCLESIKISEKPCFEDRRVIKHSSFVFEGRTVPVTSNEIERVWNW